MATSPENTSMALFCDFENVAIGVRDARYDRFDIKRVLERLLLKGSIVVKKAYCDWERYKAFKGTMHEANFELIEIPHVRQSGKNSADIRLVVDALDLCYTKSHVNTFVIISGDSDFSPLVSKLRENAKQVIGVGVKQSTSDLLIANCDEFIFYDELVRESQRVAAKRQPAEAPAPATRREPEDESRRKDEAEGRRRRALDLAVETFEALAAERGDSGRIWPSMIKQAIKRRRPDFSESAYGFRTFGALLEDAQARGLLDLGRDDKGNIYVQRASSAAARPEPAPRAPAPHARRHEAAEPPPSAHEPRHDAASPPDDEPDATPEAADASAPPARRRTRAPRKSKVPAQAHVTEDAASPASEPPAPVAEPAPAPAAAPTPALAPAPAPRKRAPRKSSARGGSARKASAPSPESPADD